MSTSSPSEENRNEPPEPELELPSRTLVIFRVAATWLALAAEYVEEICDQTAPMPLPHAPPHIPGLMNLRGHALPLLNLQVFLRLPEQPAPQPPRRGEQTRPRVLLVTWGGMRVGLMCDHVRALQQVPGVAVRPTGALAEGELVSYAHAELCTPELLAPILDLPTVLEAARVRR